MGTPILSPNVIYWIDVLSNIDVLTIVLTIMISIVLVLMTPIYICWKIDSYDDEYPSDVETNKLYVKLLKSAFLILVTSLLITLFIPAESTMYKMLISNYVTEENLNTAGDTIKESVDYIFEKIDELGD
jgi:hypothetical protein